MAWPFTYFRPSSFPTLSFVLLCTTRLVWQDSRTDDSLVFRAVLLIDPGDEVVARARVLKTSAVCGSGPLGGGLPYKNDRMLVVHFGVKNAVHMRAFELPFRVLSRKNNVLCKNWYLLGDKENFQATPTKQDLSTS